MPQIMRITSVGLPTQEQTILQVAANLAATLLSSFDLKVDLLDPGERNADLAVVNGDSPEGIRYLGSATSVPLKIVVVTEQHTGGGHFFLQRPVRVQELKDAIYDLWSRHQAVSQQVRTAPALYSATSLAQLGTESLFGAMLLAQHQQQVVEYSNAHGQSVLLDGKRGLYYTGLDNNDLEAMAQKPGTVTTLGPAAAQLRIRGYGGHLFGDLVWMAAWFGARKGVLEEERLDIPVRLRAFPRLPKQFLRPEYVRIAAMLTKTPMTLRQLSRTSGVVLERVVEFSNIATVLGILEVQSGFVPTQREKGTVRRSGLLAKLARRLALNTGSGD